MILYISVTTIILAIVISIYNYQINKNSLYLAGFLIPLSIAGILHYYSIIDDNPDGLVILYGHFIPVLFLTGPMLYLYIRGILTDRSQLHKLDILHFLPAFISLISILPYYFEQLSYKIEIVNKVFYNPNAHKTLNISWLYPSSLNILLRAILQAIYILASICLLVKYKLKMAKNNTPIEQKNIALNWVYTILLISTVVSVSYLIITHKYYFGNNTKKEISEYGLNYVAAISFSLIPLLMLIFPEHLYGIPVNRKMKSAEKVKNDLPFVNEAGPEKTDADPFNEVAQSIMDYLQNEKPYVNPDFSIDDLAKILDIQKHHLYYCFNNILMVKFTSLRTKLRVDYTKEILMSGDLTTMSMEGIWTKAGFSSRTNFFVSFKEETGLTPLEFIKNQNLGELREN